MLLRELENRQLGACATAGDKLRDLFQRSHRFDCADPAARAGAVQYWSSVIH
jgi:hypothetical protein